MYKVGLDVLTDSRDIIKALLGRLPLDEKEVQLIQDAEEHIKLLEENYICPEEQL